MANKDDKNNNRLEEGVSFNNPDLYSDDDYDFLDSLMGDVMGNNESQADRADKESSSASEYEVDDKVYIEESETYKELPEEVKVYEESKRKRAPNRRPLLQDIMNASPEVDGDDRDLSKQESSSGLAKDTIDGQEHLSKSSHRDFKSDSIPVRGGLLGKIGSSDVKDEVDMKDNSQKDKGMGGQLADGRELKEDLARQGEPEIQVDEQSKVSKKEVKTTDKFVFNHRREIDDNHEETFNELVDENNDDNTRSLERELDGSVGVELDNMFESMFDNLTSDRDDDKVIKDEDKELDPEVIIPLETPEMSEIKVTPDGKTLADMLTGVRSGNRAVTDIAAEVRNQEAVVEFDGKKYSDNRYTKHIEEIEKEREEQDERRSLSKKFIQRNAEFTEQEKIIMENLGISNEQFSKVMSSKEMTRKQKEELLGLGRYGAERHFKGRKYRTTVGDTAMLEFLVKFKFANTRILRWISNEPQNRTWRKLNRLRENGLVESRALIGVPDLWAATYAGVGVSGHSYKPGLRPMPKMITVSSTMGINYIAACLWFNSVNVLNMDDFPQHNREIALQDDGRDKVRGEMLVSELEIRSSLGKEINPNSTTMQTLGDERLYDVIASNVRQEVDKWEQGGKVGPSPEMLLGNEYMWVLFPTSQLTMSYHVPDLVVQRERGPNGEPRSIAVEMERYEKGGADYDKIMLAYKLDEHLYEEVVWITPNTRVARALEQGARNVGFENYRIIPIITETGVYNKQDIWMI